MISPEDRAFWSFRPIADPPSPAVKDSGLVQGAARPLHPRQARRKKGLHPVAPADKRTLIRRATFDLIGLPPTPEEIDAFLADDSPDAFAKVVDRLLASPHYGERWARHWLDVARYGEDQAHTFQARLYPGGYRYRDWVIQAFNDDMPYDRFVTEQIAGDLLKTGDPMDRLPALGFFALGPHYYMDAGEAKAAEAAELDDRVDVLGRGFLGLTVACARCHDHKFDPITTQDYYALAGVFKSSRYVETPMAPPTWWRNSTRARRKSSNRRRRSRSSSASRRRSWGRRPEIEESRPSCRTMRKRRWPHCEPIWSSSRSRRRRSRRSSTLSPTVPAKTCKIYLHGNTKTEGSVAPAAVPAHPVGRRTEAVHAGQRPAGAGPGDRQIRKIR